MKGTVTRIRPLVALLLGVFAFYNSYATHIMGSDISFRCLGGNDYEIVVAVYRDCSGVTMPNTILVDVSSNCGSSSVTCTLDQAQSSVEVSQLCPSAQSTCSGGNLPGVELYTYTGTVTIQPGCGLYTFSYSDCCRNQSNNLVDPAPPSLGFSVAATLNSSQVSCNNAPSFTSLPVPYFCVNQQVNYSHGSVDTDGDSLVYTLIAPRDDVGTGLFYQGTYSAANPMPTLNGFIFDQATGQMSFTPTQQGVYVVDVLVTEYRNGVVIGTTMRDIQIVIINCNNNSPQVANCLTPANVTGGVITDCNSLGVCPGTTVSFTLAARDIDGDALTVTSNIASSIPGATLTTTNVGGPDSVITVFTWTPSALDTGFRYFTVQFQDDACPIPGLQLFTYDITIFEGTDAGQDRYYCPNGGPIEVAVFGGSEFSWNTTSGMVSATPDSNVVLLAPSATTTYIVTSDLQGGCKQTDTITVFRVPDIATSITSPDDTICLNQSTTLTAVASPANLGPFTYQWAPASQGISSPTQATTNVKPNTTTVYEVAVTSAAGCVVRDSFKVVIQGVGPKVTLLPSDNYVCPGSPISISASVSALSCGPTSDPLNPCLPNSNFEIQDLGNGNGSDLVTPYRGFYADGRVQYLYRASELQALGLSAGTITDLGFNVTGLGNSSPYEKFNIKMGCTSLSQLPANYVAGLTQVLNDTIITINTTGWNTHTLDVPYNWDGFSNLIVEVCFDNATWLSGSDYDAVGTTTVFTGASLYANNDVSSNCNLPTPTVSDQRPDTRFIMCEAPLNNYTLTWTGSNGTVLPNAGTVTFPLFSDETFTLLVDDGTCQGDTSISLNVDTAVLISAGNDTVFCNGDTLQLNAQLLHPSQLYCVQGYDLSNIAFSPITPTGAVSAGPVGDDNVSNAITIPFNFEFYCNTVTSFYISTNGFISFTNGQGAGCCSGQQLPDAATPNNVVALCWEDLNTNNGGSIDHFVVGNAPNRVQVIRWKNVAYFGNGGNIDGEIHLYETTNLIEVLVNSQTNPAQVNTLGIENATGTSGLTPAGYNASPWTVGSPVAFRFTPQTAGNVLTGVQWSPSTGLSSDTVQNPKAYPTTTTTYVVTATFSNGCVTTDTIQVGTGSFNYSVAAQPDTICPGDTTQLVFTGNGVSYLWSPASNLSSTTAQSPFAWPIAETVYYVTAFNQDGCRADDSLRVYMRRPSVTLGADTAVCPYDSITLVPSGGPYQSYNWSTGAVTPTITTGGQTAVTQAYYVRVFDGVCNIPSDTVVVTEFTLNPLVVAPSGDTGTCVGGAITLTGDPGYSSYLWSNGSTTPNITVNTAGYYSYIAIDSNGCKLNSLDTAHVIISQPPVAEILLNQDSVCEGQDNVLYVNAVQGIDYVWAPGGVLGDTLIVTAAGTYYLTATDNGCASYDSVTVYSVPAPVVSLGPDQNVCGCDTSVLLLPTVNGSYNWSNNQTSPTISVNTSGTYTVTVTDDNLCSGTASVEVTIRCLTVSAFVADPPTATVFVGRNATLSVDSFSYNSNFTYLWSPNTYLQDATVQQPYVQSAQATTTYTVQVTDAVYGCVAYDSVRLSVVPPGVPPMPNAFSPNGDGANDVYGPYFPPSLQGVYTISAFRIYNRWGQLVYDGTGYWDGTFNGTLQPAGTYFYYITITGPDQNNPNANVDYNLTGAFTLLH